MTTEIEQFLNYCNVEATDDLRQQVGIFVDCLQLRQERGKRYGDTWKRRGYKGSLWMMDHKMLRLDEQWMRNTPEEPEATEMDDALDLINYTCFFIQNAIAGRVWDGR